MSSLKIFEQKDFTGGLNFRADQFQLADNESPKMLNVEIDPRGGVFSRGGITRINPTDVAGTWTPQKLYSFGGATPTIMLATATRVYKSTGTNFSLLEYASGSPIVATSPHGACMAQWGKRIYISTGATGNGGYVWETADTYATALTASGDNPNAWQATPDASRKMPTAEHLVVHANKMFAANTTEVTVRYPNRLRWSLENSPENWDEPDYIDINGGGDGITGMAVVAGQLVIFKPRAVYVLFGYDDANFQVVELTSTVGCADHHAMAVTETGVYFYYPSKGLYFYNGSGLTDVFENLRPMLDLGYVNTQAGEAVTVSYIGRRVWLSLPYSETTTVTDPTMNFVYDPSIGGGAWMQFQTADGYGLLGGTDFRDSTGNELRLMIHPIEPCVVSVDNFGVATDNIYGTTQSFPSYYRTKWFDGGSYMQKKMFRRPDIVLKESNVQQNIVVDVYHNFDEAEGNEKRTFTIALSPPSGGMVWGTGTWGQNWSQDAISSTVVTGKNLGLARTVQLQFNGPTGSAWGLDSIGYKFQPRRVKG